jgi:hypothetical protein
MDIHSHEHSIEGPSHYITQNGDWKVTQERDVVFINQQTIDNQKNAIKMIVKQIGSNILSGKSIMNMSLPV